MSLDIIVYITPSLSEVIDTWQEKFTRLGETGTFDSQAKQDIRQTGTFNGFFPVGEEGGFELYTRTPSKEEINDADAPPQLAKARYAITFSIADEDLRVGYLCAGALVMAADGIIVDTYTGGYLTPEQAIAQGRELSE